MALKIDKTNLSLESTEELCLMALKIDKTNLRETLICCFKNDKNLVNFDSSTRKSQKVCNLIGPFP